MSAAIEQPAATQQLLEAVKDCGQCKEGLPLRDFGACSASPDGRSHYCKACNRKRSAEQRRRAKRISEDHDGAIRRQLQERDLESKMFKARPEHFNQAWPTIRTETFVEMVLGSIKKRGTATQEEIVEDTKLEEDRIGEAIADLVLWKKKVGTRIDELEETRFYFVK